MDLMDLNEVFTGNIESIPSIFVHLVHFRLLTIYFEFF